MDAVRDLLAAHAAAAYPADLPADAWVGGVSLAMLEADVAGLAAAFLAAGGALRADQWFTLRACAADARAVLPGLDGERWVYVARLYALARAVLREAPGTPHAPRRPPGPAAED